MCLPNISPSSATVRGVTKLYQEVTHTGTYCTCTENVKENLHRRYLCDPSSFYSIAEEEAWATTSSSSSSWVKYVAIQVVVVVCVCVCVYLYMVHPGWRWAGWGCQPSLLHCTVSSSVYPLTHTHMYTHWHTPHTHGRERARPAEIYYTRRARAVHEGRPTTHMCER